MRGKKCVFTLTLAVLLGAIIASVPAESPPTVSFYVDPLIKSGESPGTYFSVDVWIDSPIEWRDAANGIIGWTFDVKVDANVIQPAMVDGGAAGYFLYDFLQQYNHGLEGYSVSLLTAPISPPTGEITDIAEFIMPLPDPGTFGAGGSGKLCELWFKSYSLTGYSPIDISNAWYWMTDRSKVAVDIVYDGHYNEPPEAYLEADLVRRGAWPEHQRFVRSEDGGYQALYGEVKNLGDDVVTVKVVFGLMKGELPGPPIETADASIAPGEIIVLTANFAGFDGLPWDAADDGKWDVNATCKYFNPYTEIWESGEKIKTFKFSVVP